MRKSLLDFWVGLFVLVGLIALLFLALKAGNMSAFSFAKTYQVRAAFDNIGGLKVRAPVKSAGVVVGRVSQILFDDKSYQATVVLDMDQRYQFQGFLGQDPDLGAARRTVRRPGAGRRFGHAGRRQQDHDDAVGRGAGEPDQPVPL